MHSNGDPMEFDFTLFTMNISTLFEGCGSPDLEGVLIKAHTECEYPGVSGAVLMGPQRRSDNTGVTTRFGFWSVVVDARRFCSIWQ